MSGFSLSEEGGVSLTAKTDAPPIYGDFIYVIIGEVEAVIMVSFIVRNLEKILSSILLFVLNVCLPV
jgi:hypothetical protein